MAENLHQGLFTNYVDKRGGARKKWQFYLINAIKENCQRDGVNMAK
jgi:hypothetical protein